MYIHKDGQFFPYNWNSLEEDSNLWQQVLNRNNEVKNETMSNFNKSTTSYSLHPQSDDEINSNRLSFQEDGQNLWKVNPQIHQDVHLNENPLSKESFEEYSKNTWQLQMPQESNLTCQASIQANIGTQLDQTNVTLEEQSIQNNATPKKDTLITSPLPKIKENNIIQPTSNLQPRILLKKSFPIQTLENTSSNEFANIHFRSQSMNNDTYYRLNKDPSFETPLSLQRNLTFMSNKDVLLTQQSCSNPQLESNLPFKEQKNLISSEVISIPMQENNIPSNQQINISQLQNVSSSIQENNLFSNLHEKFILQLQNDSISKQQNNTISNQQRNSISQPQNDLISHDSIPNDLTPKQERNSPSQQSGKSIFLLQINPPFKQENKSPSYQQREFSIEQERILHPTQKRLSFFSKERRLSHNLQNESLSKKSITKLQDLQSNASTTSIKPYLDSEKNAYLQPTMQLDASTSLDLNIDVLSENPDKKKDFKSPILLNLEKIGNQNQSESSYRLQEHCPKAFHFYKQNLHKIPHPKWIQKLIIIPAQRNGCHNITSAVFRHLETELLYFKCGLAQLFLQQSSASLAIHEKCDGNNAFSFVDENGKYLNKLISKEKGMLLSQNPKEFDIILAQLKSIIFGCSLMIPITNGKFNLGPHQIICLIEHQQFGNAYSIVVTLNGEGCLLSMTP